MKKKCQVVMLPSEKVIDRQIIKCIKSFDLGFIEEFHNKAEEGELQYVYHNSTSSWDKEHYQSQHIYILSDEEIKEGDWFYNTDNNSVQKADKETQEVSDYWGSIYKKIIATTDKSLWWGDEYNYLRPSDEFLKKYCELGGIDEVLVEYEDYLTEELALKGSFTNYRLKVAPDNTITIVPVKPKVYTKEEVIKLLYQYKDLNIKKGGINQIFTEDWIKENLK